MKSVSLTKWLSFHLLTKWLWVQIQLQLLKISVILSVLSKKFLDIWATAECRFTLKHVCDMIKTHIHARSVQRALFEIWVMTGSFLWRKSALQSTILAAFLELTLVFTETVYGFRDHIGIYLTQPDFFQKVLFKQK